MQYSYQLFKYHNISIKIHIVYIITVIIAPIIFLLFFNILAALAILQFILLLSLSVFLHELGQVNFARRFKIYFKEIVLLPFGGIKIRETTPENTSDEIKIAFAGLTVYLVMFLLMLPIIFSLYGFDNVFRTHIYEFSPIIKFFQINAALLIFNAIPMYPMDGGRILRGYLSQKYNYLDATKLAKWVSYAFIIMLLIIGLFFGYILIVLAFFLYFSAISKGRLDQTIKVLEIRDGEAKAQEPEEYLASRKRILCDSKGIRTKAGKVLEASRFGFLLMIWIKFRDYFGIELTKGKLNWVREKLFLILPKILRIRNLFKLWLKTRPVRKSIFFLLLAAICLTLVWTLFLEFMPLLDIGFFLCFGLGTFIIYYHTRSRKLMYFTIFGCFFWLMYLALEVFEPLLNLDYWGYLYYEGFRGCMVPLTGMLFFAAIVNSNDFFKRANTHMPLPMFIIISVMFIIGVFVLFYEIYLLSAYENDLDTIRYILRYDIAYLIWFLASALILASLIYMLYIGSISHYGRITTLKLTAATVVDI